MFVRERDALLTKEQRRLSILLKELQQTRHRIERTDRNISAIKLEQHDVKKELMSTSARGKSTTLAYVQYVDNLSVGV